MSALRQLPEPAAASPQVACGGRAATLQSLESGAQWGALAESLSQSAPSRLCGQWEVLSATRPPESTERRLELTLPTPVPVPGLRTRSTGRGPQGAEVLSLAGRRGWTLGYWTQRPSTEAAVPHLPVRGCCSCGRRAPLLRLVSQVIAGWGCQTVGPLPLGSGARRARKLRLLPRGRWDTPAGRDRSP